MHSVCNLAMKSIWDYSLILTNSKNCHFWFGETKYKFIARTQFPSFNSFKTRDHQVTNQDFNYWEMSIHKFKVLHRKQICDVTLI